MGEREREREKCVRIVVSERGVHSSSSQWISKGAMEGVTAWRVVSGLWIAPRTSKRHTRAVSTASIRPPERG